MALPSSSQLPTLRELSIVAREGKQILRSFLGQNQGLYELDSKADIKRILRENDEERQRAAMESLLTGYCLYKRFDGLYPDVVKIMGTSNLELKRLCYIFIVLACHASRQGRDESSAEDTITAPLLTINGFQKDASHRNHIVRAWALKAMLPVYPQLEQPGAAHGAVIGSTQYNQLVYNFSKRYVQSLIQMAEVIPSVVEAMRRGVADGSPYVRYTVAQTCPKLVFYDPTLVGFATDAVLLRLLHDVEDVVVAAAVHSLYQITLMFPDLLEVDVATRRRCVSLYSLSQEGITEDSSSATAVGDPPPPFLSRLHPVFNRFVGYIMERLPHYGQVAAIYLLTHYCRTFFKSPDDPTGKSSGHYQLFLSKLLSFAKYSASSVVFLAACRGLLLLSSKSALSETLRQIIPYTVHRLRVSPAEQHADLLELLVLLVPQSDYDALGQVVSSAVLLYNDSARVRCSKLRLFQALAVFPDFPLESVFQQLLAAARWNKPAAEWSNDGLFDAMISIFAERLRLGLSVPLESLIENLLAHSSAVTTPALLQQMMRTLCEMTRLSERLDPARIQSVLLLVARRLVVMLENLSCCSEGGAGLAAAVELIAAHHAAAPDVALDAFRILVKSLTQNLSGTTTGTNEELQLATLNFGASLWVHHGLKRDEQPEICSKLDRLWTHFVITLQSPPFSNRVSSVAFLCGRLSEGCSDAFQKVFTPKFSSSETCVISNRSGIQQDESKSVVFNPQVGMLSFAAMIHLQGCSRLPEFITDNDVINFSREEVPDTVRASPLTTSVSLQARSQRSVNGDTSLKKQHNTADDEDVDNFYGSVGWHTEASVSKPDTVDPLISLFGHRGVVVYGEEAETDDEEEQGHGDSSTDVVLNSGEKQNLTEDEQKQSSEKHSDEETEDEEDWRWMKQTAAL